MNRCDFLAVGNLLLTLCHLFGYLCNTRINTCLTLLFRLVFAVGSVRIIWLLFDGFSGNSLSGCRLLCCGLFLHRCRLRLRCCQRCRCFCRCFRLHLRILPWTSAFLGGGCCRSLRLRFCCCCGSGCRLGRNYTIGFANLHLQRFAVLVLRFAPALVTCSRHCGSSGRSTCCGRCIK